MSFREKDGNSTLRDDSVDINRTVRDVAVVEGNAKKKGLMQLPESLASRYVIEKELPARGAEADLVLVRRLSDSTIYAAKIYRTGIEPKEDVLDWLKNADQKFVIRQIEKGKSDGRWFEIMEYAQLGSLRELINLEGPALHPDRVQEILRELASAIAYLLSLTPHVIHRDIKPENILVRSLAPLDLVLTDFSIASTLEYSQRFTSSHRTIKYSAPELMVESISPATDWWPLGMILVEALTGKHPFDKIPEPAVNKALYEHRPIDLSKIPEERWVKICKGLLLYDVTKRWGKTEVDRWLANDPSLPMPDAEQPGGQSQDIRPYIIGGISCRSKVELARAMSENWSEALKRVGRVNDLLSWFQTQLCDQDIANYFQDLVENNAVSVELKLTMLLINLDPTLPLYLGGQEYSPAALRKLGERVFQGDETSYRLVEMLKSLDLLMVFADGTGNAQYADIAQRWGEYSSLAPQIYSEVGKIEPLQNKLPEPLRFDGALLAAASQKDWQKIQQSTLADAWKSPAVRTCPWIKRLPNPRQASVPWLVALQSIEKVAMQTGSMELQRLRSMRWKKIFTAGVAAILVLVVALVYYKHHVVELEATNWAKAKNSNTEESYKEYLAKYPDGSHEPQAFDEIEWLKALAENSAISLQNYLDKGGKFHNADAKKRIDDIRWESATKDDTSPAYISYIKNNSLGLHVEEAKKKLDDREWEAAVNGNTIDGYTKYMDNKNNLLHQKDALNKIEYLRDRVTKLSDIPILTWKDVIALRVKTFFLDKPVPDSTLNAWVGAAYCPDWKRADNEIEKSTLKSDVLASIYSAKINTRVRFGLRMVFNGYDANRQSLIIGYCSNAGGGIEKGSRIGYVPPEIDTKCKKIMGLNSTSDIRIKISRPLPENSLFAINPLDAEKLIKKLASSGVKCRYQGVLSDVYVEFVADIRSELYSSSVYNSIYADLIAAYIWVDEDKNELIGILGNASLESAK